MKIKKIILLANHNNGYNILSYLLKRRDARIVKVIVYEDSRNQWWKSVKQLSIEEKLGYIIFKSNRDLYDKIKNLDFDLLLSVSWRHKVPSNILRLAKLGSVNFHNSLLPNYRGAYANTWPIFFGENKTGVTLHFMTEDFDSGDIIFQEQFKIHSWETAKDIWKKINKYYLLMFKKMWPLVDKWRKISYPQEGKASYYSINDYKKTDKIDLDKKVKIKDFLNFLRAKTFKPYKNAYFIDPETGKKIYISLTLEKENGK